MRALLDGQGVDGVEGYPVRVPVVEIALQPDAIVDASLTDLEGTVHDQPLGPQPLHLPGARVLRLGALDAPADELLTEPEIVDVEDLLVEEAPFEQETRGA